MTSCYCINAFGAVADGLHINTEAIQGAIDAAHAAGGGRVEVPSGVYVTGSLELKSHVELHLCHGAVLKGSPCIGDYPDLGVPFKTLSPNYSWKSLVWALDAQNIALTGSGTMDGNGTSPDFQVHDPIYWNKVANRPHVLYFVRCTDVLVCDVTLRDSAFWMQHLTECRRLRYHRVRIFNYCNHNNDGLDLDNCTDVQISDCLIECSDDALCLKSMTPGLNERITVTNCILRSHYNCVKIGTETAGGVRDFTLSNCVLCGPEDEPHRLEPTPRTRGFSGIALMSVDGSILENITISNVTIHHVQTPFFIRLQNRGTTYWPGAPEEKRPGTAKRISISHVIVRDVSAQASSITGLPGACVEDVTLSDIILELPGGGTQADIENPVPENEGGYPDCNMFKTNLPAAALYLRHVRGARLSNWTIRVSGLPEPRPSFVTDDVENFETNHLTT